MKKAKNRQAGRRWSLSQWAYLALALVSLAQGGCLLVAAGVAGGATAAYLYCNGKDCRVYNASFADSVAATKTALAELGMPLVNEQTSVRGEGFVESRTADGDKVRIYFDVQPSKFPAEGALTRLCVRVATFGDHPVGHRILDQVGAHLVPAGMLAGPPAVPPLAAPTAPDTPLPPPRPLPPQDAQPLPQTAPPPLATLADS